MFSEKIKALRAKKGLSQEQAARYLGISRRQYRRYETGENEPTLGNIKKLCRLFNVSADYLIGLDSDETTFKQVKDDLKELDQEELLEFINNCLKLLLELVEKAK